MNEITLNGRTINNNTPTYIIAEMSASHAGSKERAIEIMHAAKECGADCIKTQTYTCDTLTINSDKPDFIHHGGLWDGYTYYQLYKEAFTPWEWQEDLMAESKKIGIDFFSTPFDKTAVDFLEDLGVSLYKIASFEVVDIPLIKYVASKGKPIIMSTGMATTIEIGEAVAAIRDQGNEQIALLKCSSVYPARTEHMNLITIPHLRDKFNVIPGLSDHSMGSLSSVVGVTLGAKIVEKHICLDRKIESNPDAGFSMEPTEFKQLVNDIRDTEKAIGIEPFAYTNSEVGNRAHRRSLYVCEDIRKGEVFTSKNVRSIRPSYGLHTRHLPEIIGRIAAMDLGKGERFTMDMVSKG